MDVLFLPLLFLLAIALLFYVYVIYPLRNKGVNTPEVKEPKQLQTVLPYVPTTPAQEHRLRHKTVQQYKKYEKKHSYDRPIRAVPRADYIAPPPTPVRRDDDSSDLITGMLIGAAVHSLFDKSSENTSSNSPTPFESGGGGDFGGGGATSSWDDSSSSSNSSDSSSSSDSSDSSYSSD